MPLGVEALYAVQTPIKTLDHGSRMVRIAVTGASGKAGRSEHSAQAEMLDMQSRSTALLPSVELRP